MAGVEKSSFSLFNVWQFYNGYPQLKIWPGRYRLSNFFLSCNCISDCLNVRKYTAANTSTSWSWNAAQASPNFLCRIIGNYEINSRDIINTLTFSSILTQILQNISTEPRKHTILPRNHDTFQKLPTFLTRNFTLHGLFHQELVVPIISEVAFSTLLYSIFGKIKQNIAFQ